MTTLFRSKKTKIVIDYMNGTEEQCINFEHRIWEKYGKSNVEKVATNDIIVFERIPSRAEQLNN